MQAWIEAVACVAMRSRARESSPRPYRRSVCGARGERRGSHRLFSRRCEESLESPPERWEVKVGAEWRKTHRGARPAEPFVGPHALLASALT